MKFTEYGFGLDGWDNGDVAIVGVIREHGNNPVGKMRCKFAAYDLAKARQTGEKADEVAQLVLVVNLGDGGDEKPSIDKFININVTKHLRKMGIGRRIVNAALEAAAGDMEICDIEKNSKGFWLKAGATDFETRGRNGLIYAVMRKPEAVLEDSLSTEPQSSALSR